MDCKEVTVQQLLDAMKLVAYTHVIVRGREKWGLASLGGSCDIVDIGNRFGSRIVRRCSIVNNILYIDVR